MKRIFLFLLTNILVITTISIILNLLGFRGFLTESGIDYYALMLFCLVWGMGGAFISLALSKTMAKMFMRVKIIKGASGSRIESELVNKVHTLSRKAGLSKMPEVGIYESDDINAFATGMSRNSSLVAVSTGLLSKLDEDEVEGVLGHEVAHIANGDMVTLALIQGVVNAFTMFLARIIAYAITSLSRSDDDGGGIGYFSYYITVFILDILFAILGSIVVCYFSRIREYKADLGGAELAGKSKMISALKRLQSTLPQYRTQKQESTKTKDAFATMQISNRHKLFGLFSTHPPLEDRIKRLQKTQI